MNRHSSAATGAGAAPGSPERRRLLAALGACALAALLPGCVTPPAPRRPLDDARAPRVGDSWRYAYDGGWANVAPRMLEVRVVAVAGGEVRDRMTVQGDAGPGVERAFGPEYRIVERPLGGVLIPEFSPYLEAFGPVPAGTYAVAIPPSTFGSAWSGSARVAGTERVSVPAGTFEATRMQIFGARPFLAGMDDTADPVQIFATAWFAPEVKRFVRFSYLSQAQRLNPLARDHLALASYRLG